MVFNRVEHQTSLVLSDAALGLEAVANGRHLNLDLSGLARAALLAKKAREFAAAR